MMRLFIMGVIREAGLSECDATNESIENEYGVSNDGSCSRRFYDDVKN